MADKTEKPKRTRKTATNPLIEAGKAKERIDSLTARIVKLDAKVTKLHEERDAIMLGLSNAAREILDKAEE